MVDKRKNKRSKTLWKVNIVNNKIDEKFIGYLMDLSEGGAKFYIDKTRIEEIQNVFYVKINPPYEIKLASQVIKVECVWQRETHFLEMGVKFDDMNQENNKYLHAILDYFSKDKKVNFETEIFN